MKITKGLTPPDPAKVGRPREYNFQQMGVGDAADINASYQTVYACIRQFKKNDEYKEWSFRIEKIGKSEKKVRVWRTA